jgi:hypothetical protein
MRLVMVRYGRTIFQGSIRIDYGPNMGASHELESQKHTCMKAEATYDRSVSSKILYETLQAIKAWRETDDA